MRIRVGQPQDGVLQPLQPEHITDAVAAVTTPADRPILAPPAVLAARPGTIRRLHFGDLGIGNPA
ncbi:hypothetical protein [Peterkaempfera sp. SMS 1(5)a]|uniref:hypothetical protein n=1 Tax=Peterkaempfera podocarpi TaxID=3232308 RepID=UPI00366BD87C